MKTAYVGKNKGLQLALLKFIYRKSITQLKISISIPS